MTDNTEKESKELDKARAHSMYWGTIPSTEQGKHSSAHLNPEQPFAYSGLRVILNQKAIYASATFYDPRKEDKDSKYYADMDFNPKIHYKTTPIECPIGKPLIDNSLAGTMAVSGKRAQLILETNRDIGRPAMDMGIGFGGGDEELDTPEEVPKRE